MEKLNMDDSISELPEPILHLILSSLSSKDVTRTSILSKTWNSVWESFPILNFDEETFAAAMGMADPNYIFTVNLSDEMMNIRHNFSNYVDSSVARSRQRMVTIQKFRLRMAFYDHNLTSHLDRWIEFAIESYVKDLDINLEVRRGKWYDIPQSLFTCNLLTQLSLQGCKLQRYSDIHLTSLRMLALWDVLVDEETLHNLISNCPLLEYLNIVYCYGWRILKVSSSILKKVNLFLIKGAPIERIDIEAPNLCSFCYDGDSIRCEINLGKFENLKVLSLLRTGITGKVFEDFSKFPMVEELYLEDCKMVECVKISSVRLRILSLICCAKLVEAEIDAPNLLFFKYKERNFISISLLNTSDSLVADICLEYMSLNTFCFLRLAEFIRKFGNCKVLTLHGGPKMNVIIPEKLRENMRPPLYNVKHLNLSMVSMFLSDTAVAALVDDLLWMSPSVHSLCIATSNDKSFKLIFEERMLGEDDKYNRRSHHGKWWQSYLKEVKILNSDGVEEETTNLNKFLIDNAKTSNTIST